MGWITLILGFIGGYLYAADLIDSAIVVIVIGMGAAGIQMITSRRSDL